ncbi:unnamed protein product [Adineta ricciae]|uniref:C2H2-type domain-containing protein n=1 Tax=Adineta ricciae TaxID=249248 RepID=A0A814WXF1_ADIRI|nr:unnamed protein product [Adineta ricciae]
MVIVMASTPECFFKDESCTDQFISFRELRHEHFSSSVFPGARSCIEIMLLRGDRFYQPVLRLQKTHVCTRHKEELLKEFRRSKYRTCHTCVPCFGKSKPSEAAQNIGAFIALTLYEELHFQYSYGKLICRRCREAVMKRTDPIKISNHMSAFHWLDTIVWSDEESEESTNDKDFHYSPVSITPTSSVFSGQNDKSKRAALQNFIQLMHPDRSGRSLLVTHSYNELTKGAQKNFLCSTKAVIDIVLEFLAGSNANEVRTKLFTETNKRSRVVMDPKLMNILSAIAEAYNNADSPSNRRTILSIVAKHVDYNLISSVIPGLTRHRLTEARLFAVESGKGVITKSTPRINVCYSSAQVEHFIDFVLSPHISSDVPFGEKTLRLSSGKEFNVPDTIRSINSTRIIQQYYEYCHQMCANFEPLASSSLYKILNCCKASTRKSLQGLNNFVADGIAAFEDLKIIIQNLSIDSDEKIRLAKAVQRAKQYLKSDFKLHVRQSSSVADHCIPFSLSERNSTFFSSSCNHHHDDICIECTNLANVLFDIKQAIKTNNSPETVGRTMYDYDESLEAILAWKSHLLRCVNQGQCRINIMQSMSENSIFLNLDWAMKWNPVYYREGQAAFFGKKGISWHITVVSMKQAGADEDDGSSSDVDESDDSSVDADDDDEEAEKSNNEAFRKIALEHKIFVHVFDQVTQDSDAVLAILQDVLTRVKAHNPNIKNAYIRSDNAGCYHSAQTIIGLRQLSLNTNITIIRFDFSDPQGGKGSSDRYSAVLKSHVRRFWNGGHDVATAAEFVAACASYGGIKNVQVFECQLAPAHSKDKRKINDITKLHNFIFEPSTSIRVYRAWNVGVGKVLAPDQNRNGSSIINMLVCVNTHTNQTQLVNSSANKPQKDLISSTNEDTHFNTGTQSKSKLFYCDQDGCIRRFFNYGNLLRHLASGNHFRKLEKLPMKDFAMITYKSKLDEVDNQQLISLELEKINFHTNSNDHLPKLNQGWALPSPRKVQRLTPKVRQFLEEKFDDGEQRGIRWQPEAVVNEMKHKKDPLTGSYVFELSELVKVGTVRSFFSRQSTSNKDE